MRTEKQNSVNRAIELLIRRNELFAIRYYYLKIRMSLQGFRTAIFRVASHLRYWNPRGKGDAINLARYLFCGNPMCSNISVRTEINFYLYFVICENITVYGRGSW